jgi:hypothetical protein
MRLDGTASIDEWSEAKMKTGGAYFPARLPLEPHQVEQIKAVAREMIETIAPNDSGVDFDDVFERVCRKVVVQGIYDLQCFAGEDDEINEGIVRGPS